MKIPPLKSPLNSAQILPNAQSLIGTSPEVRPDKQSYLARSAGCGAVGRSIVAILALRDMIPAERALSYLVYLGFTLSISKYAYK